MTWHAQLIGRQVGCLISNHGVCVCVGGVSGGLCILQRTYKSAGIPSRLGETAPGSLPAPAKAVLLYRRTLSPPVALPVAATARAKAMMGTGMIGDPSLLVPLPAPPFRVYLQSEDESDRDGLGIK